MKIETLLKKGVNESDENGFTPLILAAFAGNEKVVNFLLKQEGIQVNKACFTGSSPLVFAAYEGHSNVVA